jgi:hypothetical protein
MIFYPFNLFSILLLGAAYGLLVFCFVFLVYVTRGMAARKALLGVIGGAFLVLPLAEELWVAWNFGQLCKEAGLSVNKTVEVDGFYDDTHSWSERRMNEAGYRFVEGRAMSEGKDTYWRHERVGNEIRSFRIEKPSARYQFRIPHNHSRVADVRVSRH